MNIYVMQVEMQDHFTFHAEDIRDASDKAFEWARRQGLDVREVRARIATGLSATWSTNDEFVS